MTTMLPCPVCKAHPGACWNCGGYGSFTIERPPPYFREHVPCTVCHDQSGYCPTCNGDCEITEEHYNTIVQHHDEPLPSDYANDTEKWKDIL